ncbi:unnamed protein product [Amoebophrya sp. A25]|nr:unnamed protein product [Amoebophrya sp. A25]|eukprot:GSA25T00024345001.1
MLADKTAPIEHVLQVWYSSTWSQGATQTFLRATKHVLSEWEKKQNSKECRSAPVQDAATNRKNEEDEAASKVMSYLRHWIGTQTISLAVAHTRWFTHTEKHNARVFGYACSFCRRIDRLALTQYALTGQICSGKTASNGAADLPSVGSLCMWNVPDGAPPLEEDYALGTMLIEDLLEEHLASSASLDVVGLFAARVSKSLSSLRDHISKGRLKIDLGCGTVKAVYESNAEVFLKSIADLHPYTVSWSNVIDYFSLQDFHTLARRCSSPLGDTVHYGYSMNWVADVFGTCVSDYATDMFFPQKHGEATPQVQEILNMCLGKPAKEIAKMTRFEKLLTVPYFDTPLNICGHRLAQLCHDDWAKHFAKNADGSLNGKAACFPRGASGFSLGKADTLCSSPLYRTDRSVFMAWTYDPRLNLKIGEESQEDGLSILSTFGQKTFAQLLQKQKEQEEEQDPADLLAQMMNLGRGMRRRMEGHQKEASVMSSRSA